MIYSTPEVKIEVLETEDFILASNDVTGDSETPIRPVSYNEGYESSSVLGLR